MRVELHMNPDGLVVGAKVVAEPKSYLRRVTERQFPTPTMPIDALRVVLCDAEWQTGGRDG